MPIEGVVLQMKSMHIDAVVNFPFPTPPERSTLYKAEKVLGQLAALKDGQVTDLGRAMSLFPLSPRFARMLVAGQQKDCLAYIIAVVSAMSVGDPFLHEEALTSHDQDDASDEEADMSNLTSDSVKAKEALKLRRKAFYKSQQTHSSLGGGTSDSFRELSVVGAYEYAGGGLKFCAQHFVRPKVNATVISIVSTVLTRSLQAMEEIHKLRAQIHNIVQTNFPTAKAEFVPNLRPPNALQVRRNSLAVNTNPYRTSHRSRSFGSS